jgi:2-polyprenyl-3-methyl-5-hydroxy-6-metoxy-1,4-benzoquinol methylase
MPHTVDVVVLSNLRKEVPGVELLVGVPNDDPWSLPFAHKRVLADRLDDYDLFIYSEDDTLITEKNITAFLTVTELLPQGEIAGFLRSEAGSDGETYHCEFHESHHWDPQSVRSRGGYTFAFFTNEHAACYMLTRQQLRRAIDSGGFCVEPHTGRYDLACTASTDPYTQCGFKKMVCVSHLDDFLVAHLSNRYAGRLGVSAPELRRQIETLLTIGRNGHRPSSLFPTETRLAGLRYSKSYYEPVREDIGSLIPTNAKSVLSIGCGWGAMEAWLAKKGLRVAAIPLDPVIGACAEARGVETVYGDFAKARERLEGREFDCLFVSNVLHLVQDPPEVLSRFTDLLSDNAVVVATTPNLSRLPLLWKRFLGDRRLKDLGSYGKSGVNLASQETLVTWFRSSNLRVEMLVNIIPDRMKTARRATLGLMDRWLASEIIAVGRRA